MKIGKANAFKLLRSTTLSVFLLFANASAQVDTGSIVGTVHDPTGAVVPDAKVTVTNLAANTTLTTQSHDNGQFVVPLVKVGTYSVSVEKAGFQKFIQSGIKVDVQARIDIDVTLQLGQVSQEVQVTAAPPLLDTQTANVGQVIAERQVSELPLNGRRYDDLVFLTTGVNAATPIQKARAEGVFSVDGNTTLQNNFVLDGIDNNSYDENLQSQSAQVMQPPVDALSEFKIQTHTYEVSFGRNAGSVVNATIKSGTNEFHGNAWEFLRNRKLDANDLFLNTAGKPKPNFDRNQFGGTVGGPLKRNHTFFFAGYERTTSRKGASLVGTVPTPLMHQGNFTELKKAPKDPSIPQLAQFSGCIVKSVVNPNCLDSVGAKIFALYPLPNTNRAQEGIPAGFVGNNFISSPTVSIDSDSGIYRMDTQFRESNKFFWHLGIFDLRRLRPGIFNDLEPVFLDGSANTTFGSNLDRGWSAAAGWTRTIGPTIVNEARGGFNRVASRSQQTPFGTPSVAANFGVKGIPDFSSVVGGGLPAFNLSGFANLGSPRFLPQNQFSQVYQFEDTLSMVKGSHTFKFGGGWRRDTNTLFDLCCNRGVFEFNGQYTGSAATDLLLGLPQSAGLATLSIPHAFNDSISWFFQDTWRAGPRLTLNYGVRYEYTTPRIERDNRVTNFDRFARGGLGGLVTAPPDTEETATRSLVEPWKKGFAPRVGVAYKITDKLVFRGGGGIFFQSFDRQGSESLLELNPPFVIDTRRFVPANQPPTIFLKNGFPADTLTTFPLDDFVRLRKLSFLRIVNRRLKPGYVENFSAGFQYSIHSDLVIDAAWVGNFGHRLWTLGNLNQGILNSPGKAPIFPFPDFPQLEFKDSNGNLNYNALQLRVEKRWSQGLTFLVSYTLSKALSDVIPNLDVGAAGGGNGRTFFQDNQNRKADKALSLNDTPQRLVTSFSYELPAGRGHRLFQSGVASHIFGDWQMNGILTFAGGQPLGIVSPNDTSRTGVIKVNVTRADCIAKPKFTSGGTVAQFFDTSAFAIPAPFHFGTCSNAPGIRSDGTNNVDFSLFKSIVPTSNERFRIQFRAEFFNLLNAAQFAPPGNLTVGNPSFGRLDSLAQDPREIQFALKFYF